MSKNRRSYSNQRRSFAAAVELDPVELLVNGELDTDDLTDEEIEALFEEVPEEYIDIAIENNAELFDDGEDDEDDEDDGEDDGEDIELTQEDIDNMTEEEIEAALESGELVLDEDEDGEDEGDEDEDEGDEDEEDDRSFAGYDEDEDDGDEDEYYDEDDDEDRYIQPRRTLNRGNRSFASADEAYHAGIEAGRSNAREEAEDVYVNNREMEMRAFALEEQVNDSHDFVEELIQNGQLQPRYRDVASALLIGAASIQGEVRSFAAADMGDFGNDSLFEIAVEFLGSLPRNTSFEEFEEQPSESDLRRFSADDFNSMNYNPQINREITRAVRAIQNVKAQNGEDVSFDTAFNALRNASLSR